MKQNPADSRSAPRRPSYRRRPLRRRLRRPVGLLLVALAGAGAWFSAHAAADQIEARTLADVRAVLAGAMQDWAEIKADGLQVILSGEAPSEAKRLRAINATGSVIQPGRIIDRITVARDDSAQPPDFSAELLSTPSGISLVGLVPAKTDRKAAIAQLSRMGDVEISDLLATADYPITEDWQDAFEYGITAIGIATSAKVSIRPGAVSVAAIADTAREKDRIEKELLTARPVSVALDMDIRASLPTISPFTLRYILTDEGGRFEACSADSADSQSAILAIAQAVGGTIEGQCALGMGAPTDRWGEAATVAIDTLGELGAGSVMLTDLTVSLEVPATITPEDFDNAAGRLENSLPAPYKLTATHDAPVSAATPTIEFSAARTELGGPTHLRGRISNDQMRSTVETIARARLGNQVESALRTDENTPSGWTVNVIASIEALSALSTGRVVVTPDLIQIEGVSGNPHVSEEIAARLGQRLGPGARYAIRASYDPRQDEALGLPDGEECVARMNAVQDRSKFSFASGSADFEGDAEGNLTELAEAMQNCEDYRIEIGGHTDSQGSDEFNQDLSKQRAEAVLAAMAERGLPVANLTARGYGSSQPLASNDTADGREQNRRIEMRLVSPEPVVQTAPEPGELITGITPPDAEPAKEAATAEAEDTVPADSPDDGPANDTESDTDAPEDPSETEAEVPSPG